MSNFIKWLYVLRVLLPRHPAVKQLKKSSIKFACIMFQLKENASVHCKLSFVHVYIYQSIFFALEYLWSIWSYILTCLATLFLSCMNRYSIYCTTISGICGGMVMYTGIYSDHH